jgi:multidrug efflux pump subunit AcrB
VNTEQNRSADQRPNDVRKLGPAGRVAKAFLSSKLTPLFIVASIAAGAFAVWMLPREEEPQIKVPMIDVFVGMPGTSAREVEERVTKPMEKLLREIPGVEYIYSTSSPGSSMVIVRFYVGQDEEAAIVRVNQKMFSNFDLIPPGASQPLIKPRSIDDVPILALTLSSNKYGALELRRIAAQLHDAIKQVDNVSEATLIGGQRRELRVTLDSARLATYSLTPLEVFRAIGASNQRVTAGDYASQNREAVLQAGEFLRTAEDARNLTVHVANGRPVFLRDIAEVTDGGEEPAQYVHYGTREGFAPAVTIAVAKRKGANAITVADDVLKRVDAVKGRLVPSGVDIAVTRQYGETAAEKSNELLEHMLIAVISVSLLIAITLGWRESGIVFIAIPVTLALTLTVFYLYGYTLNRITLFALIFSIGILVDDAIVVVENIARHWRLPQNEDRDHHEIAAEAVDEVGNPTILATLTVIAAILPMAFVGGLMGPYMRPIPIGASAAMLFSLIVAFVVTPWAAMRFLKHGPKHGNSHDVREDALTRFYRRIMNPLLHKPLATYGFLLGVVALLLGSMTLLYFGVVKVKMLPFDNKSEFQVVVDMPEGTTLEDTERVTRDLARAALNQPEVTDVQTYTGTSAPYNFNGLVRHYYLRRGANVADIQVNLKPKGERDLQSHEIAKQVREKLSPIALKNNARIKVAEVPPGPPVLETLVAEIYGPDTEGRTALARRVREQFEKTDGVVDVDWYVEDDQAKNTVVIDKHKAALHGISEADVASTLTLLSSGNPAGLLHVDSEKEDVPILVRSSRSYRSNLDDLIHLRMKAPDGSLIPLSELTTIRSGLEDKSIYHKNLMPVTYVTADIAGKVESPVYAILNLGSEIEKFPTADGHPLEIYTARLPFDDSHYSMKWDGEWHITYEVFRDLGLAFAAVLILIYVLVVGWFQSFLTPLIIMAAIPFSLVGILPGHGLMGAFFTATSMIGFIAGAGIVVRNSIILVDFIELRLKEGMPLDQAVIDAGAVRFRPMLLTAAAVVVGAAIILSDPIFQGLAIALMAGEIASLALSRMTVPIVYYIVNRRRQHI